MRRLPTLGRRALASAGVAAVGWLLITPAVAAAHAELQSSSPAAGARLAALPSTVTLTFNEDVFTPAFVSVTGPDDENYASGKPTVDGATVSQPVSTSDQSGAFSVAYRVVSDDGHAVSGTIHFAVGAATAGAATASDGSSDSLWDGTTIAILVIALLAVVAVGTLILIVTRPGKSDADVR